MADKTSAAKSAGKKATANIFQKIGGWFKNVGPRIARAFKNMIAELRNNVTWPTRRELVNVSLIVLAFMFIMGVVIGLIDAGAGALMHLIIS